MYVNQEGGEGGREGQGSEGGEAMSEWNDYGILVSR